MTKKQRTTGSKSSPTLKISGTKANSDDFKVEKVWSKKLGQRFTPISHYFIENYHRLNESINPNEFTLIVHLFSHKWDEEMPYPAVSSLATKMGKSKQAIRTMLRSLERKNYIKRHMRRGHRSLYDLQPLIRAIEKLYDEDRATDKAKAEAKKAEAEAQLEELKSA